MSARMQTKVRVDRVALMKIVEGRVRKAENEYKRAVAAHPKRVEEWKVACVAKLAKALADAEKGKIPRKNDAYNKTPGVWLPSEPNKPSEGRELCNLRRMFTTLKIGTDPAVMLSQEDADFYFGPCYL